VKTLLLAVPIGLAGTLLGAALARGFDAPRRSPGLENVEKDLRRVSAQLSAIERKVDALDFERRRELVAIVPSQADAVGNAAPVPGPEAVPSPRSTEEPRAGGDLGLREMVRQVFDEREKQAEQQRDERRKEWERQRADSLADQLGIQESLRSSFREIMLDYQTKVREAYRKISGVPGSAWALVQPEIRRLQEERDVKLAAFLTPDQIRKLGELSARRPESPAGRP
jgi:hypothetical protein